MAKQTTVTKQNPYVKRPAGHAAPIKRPLPPRPSNPNQRAGVGK
jgi:hypothetical protein